MKWIYNNESKYEEKEWNWAFEFFIESHIPPMFGADNSLPMASALLCCQYRTDPA
jgi:hypothetical protein